MFLTNYWLSSLLPEVLHLRLGGLSGARRCYPTGKAAQPDGLNANDEAASGLRH